ncbi:hypothetical protein VKS41_005586 [Umbelopsis sp. WA50703]
MKTISLIAILSFVGLTLAASTNTTSSNSDAKVVRVASSKDFCLFLPPVSHTKKPADLGLDAKEATSVCSTGKTTFPSHLIKSAHYKKTKNYVQITGKLNVKGGYTGFQQFDSTLPKDGECKGYKSFVSLIDAEEGYYCLRCCNNNDCPTTEASLGCQDLIPGTY